MRNINIPIIANINIRANLTIGILCATLILAKVLFSCFLNLNKNCYLTSLKKHSEPVSSKTARYETGQDSKFLV